MSTDKITESQQGRGVNSKLKRFLGLVLADVLHFKYIIVETLGKLSSLSLIGKYFFRLNRFHVQYIFPS